MSSFTYVFPAAGCAALSGRNGFVFNDHSSN